MSIDHGHTCFGMFWSFFLRMHLLPHVSNGFQWRIPSQAFHFAGELLQQLAPAFEEHIVRGLHEAAGKGSSGQLTGVERWPRHLLPWCFKDSTRDTVMAWLFDQIAMYVSSEFINEAALAYHRDVNAFWALHVLSQMAFIWRFDQTKHFHAQDGNRFNQIMSQLFTNLI